MIARRRIIVFLLAILLAGGWSVWFFGNDVLRLCQTDRPSVSHGTTNDGRLEYGKRIPTSGVNYHAYSRLGVLLGRGSVHSTVREILLDAYDQMKMVRPGVEFVYGESGWPSGGPFPPHRTHENGASIDLFVPVLDEQGETTTLPIGPWNKFGYAIEFDGSGQWHGYRIDWETLARHLLALDSAARSKGSAIGRVILAPEFIPYLRGSEAGRRAVETLPWMKGRPWVRHDEHYHVDFVVPGSNGIR